MPVRVLLADPKRSVTEMYRQALDERGFVVAVAHSGLECLDQLRTFRPDVLVLESDLPWGRGEGVLARLREDADLPRLPVLLLCASDSPEQRAALDGLPVAECCPKPLLPSQLAARLHALLGLWAPGDGQADGAEEGRARSHEHRPDRGVTAAVAAPSLRVLIVDDDPDTADTLSLLLRRAGHDPEAAYSGQAALDAARRQRPDVVLCDLGLPGMDGLQVAAALRADPATASARLIAVSGYGQDEDVVRSLQAGFERHLTKPVDPADWQRLLVET